jgi:3D (Asp-Asp-Asp) domain-containing protein
VPAEPAARRGCLVRKIGLDCGTFLPLLWPVKRWRGLWWVVTACFCLLVTPASGAGPSATLAGVKSAEAQLAANARAAVLDLYSLDARLGAAEIRLNALRGDATTLRAERVVLRHELRFARLDIRISQARLASRLRFIYAQGTTSSLDILMGARSLGDAMTDLDDLNRVAASNAEVMLEVRTSQRHLTLVAQTLAERERELAATTQAAAQTVSQLVGVKAAREAYLAGLEQQRSLDSARIAELSAEAQAAVVRSETLAPTPTPTVPALSAPVAEPVAITTPSAATALTVTSGAASGNGSTITVIATGYDLPGHTSTGLPVGWGIAAVDPSVIPLGTHLIIPGYGEAVAADTGPAIVGSTIDLWFPTTAQANAWGRRTVTIDLH